MDDRIKTLIFKGNHRYSTSRSSKKSARRKLAAMQRAMKITNQKHGSMRLNIGDATANFSISKYGPLPIITAKYKTVPDAALPLGPYTTVIVAYNGTETIFYVKDYGNWRLLTNSEILERWPDDPVQYGGWYHTNYSTNYTVSWGIKAVTAKYNLRGLIATGLNQSNNIYADGYILDVSVSNVIGACTQGNTLFYAQVDTTAELITIYSIHVVLDNGRLKIVDGESPSELASVFVSDTAKPIQIFVSNREGTALVGIFEDTDDTTIYRASLTGGENPTASIETEVLPNTSNVKLEKTTTFDYYYDDGRIPGAWKYADSYFEDITVSATNDITTPAAQSESTIAIDYSSSGTELVAKINWDIEANYIFDYNYSAELSNPSSKPTGGLVGTAKCVFEGPGHETANLDQTVSGYFRANVTLTVNGDTKLTLLDHDESFNFVTQGALNAEFFNTYERTASINDDDEYYCLDIDDYFIGSHFDGDVTKETISFVRTPSDFSSKGAFIFGEFYREPVGSYGIIPESLPEDILTTKILDMDLTRNFYSYGVNAEQGLFNISELRPYSFTNTYLSSSLVDYQYKPTWFLQSYFREESVTNSYLEYTFDAVGLDHPYTEAPYTRFITGTDILRNFFANGDGGVAEADKGRLVQVINDPIEEAILLNPKKDAYDLGNATILYDIGVI